MTIERLPMDDNEAVAAFALALFNNGRSPEYLEGFLDALVVARDYNEWAMKLLATQIRWGESNLHVTYDPNYLKQIVDSVIFE